MREKGPPRIDMGIVAAAAVIEACTAGMLLQGDLKQRMPAFFFLHFAACGAYLAAVWRCRRARLPTVLLAGLLFRATMAAAPPSLSDDVYRYLWDGRVQLAGINPYRYPPAAPELSELRDEAVWPKINHPHLPTIYPPAAQGLFALCAWAHPSPLSVKAAAVAGDLLCALFLVGLLRTWEVPTGALLIFFWHPLGILEGAGSGHVDTLGAALMTGALLYGQVGRGGRAGAALGLSALTKLFPSALLPVLWGQAASRRMPISGGPRRHRWLRALGTAEGVRLPAAFVAVAVLGYLPYAVSGADVLGSLPAYAARWEFNAPVYGLLKAGTGSGTAARTIAAAGFGATAVAVAARGVPAVRGAFILIGAFLLLTPTLHPWYGLWMLPLLSLFPSPGWIALTGLLPLSYHVLIRYASEGVWEQAPWVQPVIFGGFALTAVAARAWRRRGPSRTPEGSGARGAAGRGLGR